MKDRIKTYGSVCSGIEAASFVLEPLGIKPLWLSEIADFPRRFLSARYPHIPNLGDMNDIPAMIEAGKIKVPDFLCGGTPCQAFSLAGWKNGLDDVRGQLTLKYIEILDSIDRRRVADGLPPASFMWENVEGILKDKTNAFGHFLAGLLGLDEPIEYGRWPNAGAVFGEKRNIAWRVLDAKYFGVPQQRKRLYLLGGGKDFRPHEILFERGEYMVDPYASQLKKHGMSLFEDEMHFKDRPLSDKIKGHDVEVFRQYSDCLYAAYGTKWNGNAAAFNGSLFVCQDGRVRRLTPRECERLMGFPDDYTKIARNVRVTNRYQAIGNSWAVPVVSWIMTRMINPGQPSLKLPESAVKYKTDRYALYCFNDFVKNGDDWLNTSTFPYDFRRSHMLDIVDTDVEEKFYLSSAGCAGIIRRKMERKAGINERLELHLRNVIENK